MCEIRNRSVIEAVQQAAQNHGMKMVAAELNKAPSSLYAELNPYAEPGKAKLGLDDAVEIMRLTGDHAALLLMAGELGYMLTPVNVVPDHSDVRDEMLDDASRVGLFHALIREDAPVPVVRKALGSAHRELEETMETYCSGVTLEQQSKRG